MGLWPHFFFPKKKYSGLSCMSTFTVITMLFILIVMAFFPFHMWITAKYVGKAEGKSWTYQEAKSFFSESVEMSQSMNLKELQKLIDKQSAMYPLGPTVALTYLSVLKDCEVHCSNEGSEVKRHGGLHVIGTSLHESRRIDNQVSNWM